MDMPTHFRIDELAKTLEGSVGKLILKLVIIQF